MRRRTWLILGAAAATAAAGLWWRWRDGGVAVTTATVARGAFEETIAEEGRTRARWHVDVTATVSGRWEPESLVAGSVVRRGQLLGTLTAAPAEPAAARALEAQLGVADADLTAARAAEAATRAALEDAQRALGRAERLGAAGGVSEEQLDRLRTEVETRQREGDAARARITAATFARDAARAVLPGGGVPVRISAPDDGAVFRVDEEHPRVVPAGAPLLQVGSVGDPDVVVEVLSADAPRIAVGAAVRAIVGPDTMRGRVTRVEPAARTVRSALGVDEQRVAVIAHLDDHAPRLGHDFAVDVRIVAARLEDALVIPAGALVRDGEAWTVFVVGADGRAWRTRVGLVGRGADEAAVEGLEPGTVVVVYPPEDLTDGARVRR